MRQSCAKAPRSPRAHRLKYSLLTAQGRLDSLLRKADKAIVLGIGGGGDVAGALATARLCEDLGCEAVLGGVAWERLPIDPQPGPRPLEQIVGAKPLAPSIVLAGPETRTAEGALFAEAHMADFLGAETVLVDITRGPKAIAASLEQAAAKLGANLIVGVDVGGDVLGNGSEPGLASPLCDAVMLAAIALLARQPQNGIATLGAVFGPCCDGELTSNEILDRLAAVAGAGALLGAAGMTPELIRELEAVTRLIPTEASAQAVRCAKGETGVALIRRGRREVVLSPLGALTFYFDPPRTVATVARLARAAIDTDSLEEANDRLHDLELRTELDFERRMAEA